MKISTNKTAGQPLKEVFETKSVAGTMSLGRRFAKRLAVGDCVALIGQLGAGKTVLVRGMAEGVGITDSRDVSSPSYVLVQEYAAEVPVYHVDLYRLSDPAGEFAALGLAEMLVDGVVIIEWADRAIEALPKPRWEMTIEITGKCSRRFTARRIN